MDSSLIITNGEDKLIVDISDYSSGSDLLADLVKTFPNTELDNISVVDFGDFPESILNLPNDTMCDEFVNYHKAVQELTSGSVDAFKAFYEEEGGNPLTLLTEFNSRYAGDFNDTYDFGKDMAEACGMNLAGNESFFMYEAFGETCLMDYEVLEDRYYFRR